MLGAGVLVGALSLVIDGRRQGVLYGSTLLPLLVLLPTATLAAGLAADRLYALGRRLVGRAMVAVTVALLVYLVVIAASVQYVGVAGHRDALAQVVMAADNVGALAPLVVLQIAFVAAHAEITGRLDRRLVVFGAVAVATGTTFAVTAALFIRMGPPYDDLAPIVDAPAAEIATQIVGTVVWAAVALVGPALLWRALARADAGQRPRLSIVAAVALTPIVTVTFCILGMSLTGSAGLMEESDGVSILAVAYCVPFLIAAPGLVLALADAGWRAAAYVPRLISATVSVVIGLVFGIVVVTICAALGLQLGPDALIGVVVLTLVVGAAAAPARRRLTRALLLRTDPTRAAAARALADLGAGGEADGRAHPAGSAERIIRESLSDPDAVLGVRLPDGGWVGIDGAAIGAPPEDAAVAYGHDGAVAAPAAGASTTSATDGSAVAFVVSRRGPDEAAGVLAELRPLIERAALEIGVRDQEARIAAERARADAAAADERRRLERDLHDGVQGRLLSLALELRMAQRTVRDGDAQLVLADATDGLQRAIEELRALAAGTDPAILAERGLGPALAEMSRRMPVPVSVAVPDQRLPMGTETVAYLVVCEAVTNALKHAAASQIDVAVGLTDDVATVSVTDDGRGGADVRAGTGLRGLAERVTGAGGHLVVSDRLPSGTRLEVTLPCGS